MLVRGVSYLIPVLWYNVRERGFIFDSCIWYNALERGFIFYSCIVV